MKQVIVIIFCALFFTLSFFTGCAGPKAQIKDKEVKVQAEDGVKAAGTADKALSQPVPGQQEPAVPLTPASPAPAAPPALKAAPASPTPAAPPALKAAPASPAPGPSAGTAEKPAEKTYVDKKGKFEIRSTPFGYVKRDIKRAEAEKELSPPVPGQREPVVPLTPVVAPASPASAVPPALKAAPASPASAVPPALKVAPASPAPAVPPALKAAPASSAPAVPPALKTAPASSTPASPAAAAPTPLSPAPGSPEKLAEKKAPEKTGQISLDFDDADLYAVIRTMADILKINYIIDAGVSGKVTIHTAGVLRAEDVFPIFFQMLEVNGLTAVKEGNVYRILKLKDALRMPIASKLVREAKDIPPEERIVIQIIPLKFISVSEMTKVIAPFISAEGTIISEAASNTLLVVDKGVNILKVLRLIEVFDVSMFEKANYRFYTFQNTNTEDAVKLLKEVLSLHPGSANVKFIPITRLNTLIVVSPSPDIFGQMDAFIRQLDVPGDAAKPQIYIYSVKNGMATELGDILRSIFGKAAEIKKGAGKESVPTNPFEKALPERKATSTQAGQATPQAGQATPTAPAATETGPSVSLRGDIRITADPIRNALVIEAIPGDYKIVEKILGRLDVLPRQVLIEVVIAEVSLGKGTELGIEWNFKKDNWTETGPLSLIAGAAGLQYVLGLSQKWQVALHALARDSKLNILSSPSVLASDNKPAKIDVTTEVPIPSTSYTIQTTGPNVLETRVEYRNTGVILDVTPHINEYGLVTMDISQEVSNVGELMKVADKDYYSFNKRKITTALTVKHNQSIVIGGLIYSKKGDAATGVPWLVKIPLIRWLFGTESKSESKSELIVMITPRVITSLDDVDAVSEEFKKKMEKATNTLR